MMTPGENVNLCLSGDCHIVIFVGCKDEPHNCTCPNCGVPSIPAILRDTTDQPIMVITPVGMDVQLTSLSVMGLN